MALKNSVNEVNSLGDAEQDGNQARRDLLPTRYGCAFMTARQALGKLTLQSVHTGLGVLGSAAASGLQISEGIQPEICEVEPADAQLESLEPVEVEQLAKDDQKPTTEDLKPWYYSPHDRSNPIEILGATKRQLARVRDKPQAKEMRFSCKKGTDEHDLTSESSNDELFEERLDEAKSENSGESFFHFEDPLADEFSGLQAH